MLAALLDAIAAQSLPSGYVLSVVVIDNDVEPSARALVRAESATYAYPLEYAHCQEPGLSAVRNFALSYARGTCDLLAMIDDDECPETQWLRELIRVSETTNADAVIGPVPQRLPASAPRWIRAGRFYDLPVYPDEATIDFGYSGNCLLRLASLERFDVAFDRQLDFAGGEDMLFFRQLVARGAKMTYAARAVASETVGTARLHASYVVRLHFRRGNTLAICDRRLNGSLPGLALRLCKGVARVAVGVVSFVPRTVLHGRAGGVRASCDIALGLGALAGLFGFVYQAYNRVGVARR